MSCCLMLGRYGTVGFYGNLTMGINTNGGRGGRPDPGKKKDLSPQYIISHITGKHSYNHHQFSITLHRIKGRPCIS